MFAVFNVYKPKDIDCFKVVKAFKRLCPKGTRIGHFGTLDPFAEGVLLVGVGVAPRINDYVHALWPKTYFAQGLLGIETATGDLTSEITQRDVSEYLQSTIATFSQDFISEQYNERFLGKYMQSPHQYSAAKFEGKKLHEWARAGIKITKEPVERTIHAIEIDSYQFPKLNVRYTVSSGTYIRTLFSDCANHLGTLGVLEGLVRESVGPFHIKTAIDFTTIQNAQNVNELLIYQIPIEKTLPLTALELNSFQINLLKNGQPLCSVKHQVTSPPGLYWVYDEMNQIVLMVEHKQNQVRMKIKLAE